MTMAAIAPEARDAPPGGARGRLLTGNQAVAWGARLARPQVCPVYPITPQTPVLEQLTEFQAEGGFDAEIITPESEHSVMSACIPASLAGVRVFTATASQGLLLMHELLHYACGARAPIVMANINRTVASPWAFWPDQTDSLAQRDTGWVQLYVESAQEALDSVIQAFRVAESRDAAGAGQPRRVLRVARAGAGRAARSRRRRRLPAAVRAGAPARSGEGRVVGQRRDQDMYLAPPAGDRGSDGARAAAVGRGRPRVARALRTRLGRGRALSMRRRRHGRRHDGQHVRHRARGRRRDARRGPGGRAREGAPVPAAAGGDAARGARGRARCRGARPQPLARGRRHPAPGTARRALRDGRRAARPRAARRRGRRERVAGEDRRLRAHGARERTATGPVWAR